jgi:3-hydroxybutyryl-CoA dehydrogenase
MGAGIAQVAIQAGDHVSLHDADPTAFERAHERIRDQLTRRARGRGLDGPATDPGPVAALARLRLAPTIADAAARSAVVIEAAVEDLEVKRSIFRALDAAAPSDTVLATNTSALSVTEIAAATHRPAGVLGLHFFNPVPRMALVEVVVPEGADPSFAERAESLVRRWGKTTVRCRDTPGFIVNRVNRPFTIQALRLLEAGAATADQIDAALRAAGYPMGPFELIDLIGVDVNLAAARSIWDGLGRPERLRPSPIQERLVGAGQLGRKSGEGIYRYVDGRRVDAPVEDDILPDPADDIVATIEAAIAAEARLAVDEGVATPADIELALRLGAGHPRSPFAATRALRSAP